MLQFSKPIVTRNYFIFLSICIIEFIKDRRKQNTKKINRLKLPKTLKKTKITHGKYFRKNSLKPPFYS